MTDYEKEMIEIQYQLLSVQKEKNEILKQAFVVYDGSIPALEKLVMEVVKIKYILENGI
jgi:hypothetical protein